MLRRSAVLLVPVFLILGSCSTQSGGLKPGPGFRKSLQEALIQAKPGSVIEIPEGRHEIDQPLSLTVDGITLRGKGMSKSILSFKTQSTGSAGMLVTSNRFTIEDLAIEDTKGDGLKVKGSDQLVIRRFRAEWTEGAKETNGAYGIYPVECKNVLIEDSVVKGAADAGFYVGQSRNIIVRRNRAEGNVAGIEIENSVAADVYENTATGNTGGILVFNLPDLPMKGGKQTRVYNNQVLANNHANFAPKSAMVAHVAPGTGVMVLATSEAEVFGNTIKDNQSYNVTILSYLTTGNPMKDPSYDPYTDSIYIHDNKISGGGDKPAGRAEAIAKVAGTPLPAILYDGVRRPGEADAHICVQNNGEAGFLNYGKKDGDGKHDCALPALKPVVLGNS